MIAKKGKLFFAGIHAHDCKSLACGQKTEVMPPPEVAYISLEQSLGKPSTPLVEKGQKVKEGELIAEASGAISSNVFASVSGEVIDVKPLVGANGRTETYIVIKSDGINEKAYLPPLSEPTADDIKARIKDCGIVGLGGAGFPAAVKVAPRTPVDTLILNGAECEPYLTCDHRLMLENTDEIARGARYIAKALGVDNIIIGIEANKPDCIEAFEKYDDIQPVILKKQYPMGSEKHLIYVTTGRKVGIGKLPADSGVVVQNVATAFAVCEAVEKGKPLYERVLTVSGKAVKEPKNLWVRVGTCVKDIVEYCGGESLPPKKVIQGGPMTGLALATYDVYTHKTTSGVLLLSEKEAAAEEPTPCLNCGMCADVCPMHLMPMQTAFYSAAGDFDTAAKLGNTLACIECGACEFTCPAKRPLIQAIRKTKAYIRSKVAPNVPHDKHIDQKGRSAPTVPLTEDGKVLDKPVQKVLDESISKSEGEIKNVAVEEKAEAVKEQAKKEDK
ncbi:MAG: electron transport complex subunit RsxC [Clostridiales bacterium]|nr:electron transport complex subunit RsxC [Clostridiales bacterium]